VMALVASGLMNKQVAAKTGLAESTVKMHRGQVMRKMGAKSLADLIKMAEILSSAAGQVRRSRTPEPQERDNQGNPYQGNSRPLRVFQEEAEVMRAPSMGKLVPLSRAVVPAALSEDPAIAIRWHWRG
jgi:hypothetical protein